MAINPEVKRLITWVKSNHSVSFFNDSNFDVFPLFYCCCYYSFFKMNDSAKMSSFAKHLTSYLHSQRD